LTLIVIEEEEQEQEQERVERKGKSYDEKKKNGETLLPFF